MNTMNAVRFLLHSKASVVLEQKQRQRGADFGSKSFLLFKEKNENKQPTSRYAAVLTAELPESVLPYARTLTYTRMCNVLDPSFTPRPYFKRKRMRFSWCRNWSCTNTNTRARVLQYECDVTWCGVFDHTKWSHAHARTHTRAYV